MIQTLVEYMEDYDFPGMSTEPETIQWFAESFCEFHEKLFHTYMRLEAYHCPVVKKPANIEGYIWMPKNRIPTKYINRLVVWWWAESRISNLTCAPNVDYAIKK